MRNFLIILISFLLVFAFILTLFGFYNITSSNVNGYGEYLINYSLSPADEGNFFTNYCVCRNVDTNDLNYYFVAYREVLRLDPSLGVYYNFGYQVFVDKLSSYITVDNYLSNFSTDVQYHYLYLTTYNGAIPFSRDFIDFDYLLLTNSLVGLSNENNNIYLGSGSRFLTARYGFNTVIKSISIVCASNFENAPEINTDNILNVFKYVFVDYPSFVYGFIGDTIKFILGRSVPWGF